MLTCKICLKQFKKLRFNSPRMRICGRCANDLNGYGETAEGAYKAARELLLRGMLRRATIDIKSPDTTSWKKKRAERILNNINTEVDRILPKWVNKLVADKQNKSKIFKTIRAHRRGLLHFNRPQKWGYPKNWKDIAHSIRKEDKFTCVSCSAKDVELHVHHIVYASNFGTHQKANLVTLCRTCHENEHQRDFDFEETERETNSLPSNVDRTSETLAANHMAEYCLICHAELALDATFCHKCGTSTSSDPINNFVEPNSKQPMADSILENSVLSDFRWGIIFMYAAFGALLALIFSDPPPNLSNIVDTAIYKIAGGFIGGLLGSLIGIIVNLIKRY